MARRQPRQRSRERGRDRNPDVMWLDNGLCFVVVSDGRYAVGDDRLTVFRGPEILLQTAFVRLGSRDDLGKVVSGITPSWGLFKNEVLANPSLLEEFPGFARKFEEFVAGGYFAANWDEVILSPPSGDGGFDVAARKRGSLILDEAKAYRPSRTVGHPIVRAALGLLQVHRNVDRVGVTTTSHFAPTVRAKFEHLIPGQLQLRDQGQLLLWLRSIGESAN